MIVICSLISIAFSLSAIAAPANDAGGVIWGLMFWILPWVVIFTNKSGY